MKASRLLPAGACSALEPLSTRGSASKAPSFPSLFKGLSSQAAKPGIRLLGPSRARSPGRNHRNTGSVEVGLHLCLWRCGIVRRASLVRLHGDSLRLIDLLHHVRPRESLFLPGSPAPVDAPRSALRRADGPSGGFLVPWPSPPPPDAASPHLSEGLRVAGVALCCQVLHWNPSPEGHVARSPRSPVAGWPGAHMAQRWVASAKERLTLARLRRPLDLGVQ